MKVNVFIIYCWECPQCGWENKVDYQPETGKNLPPCEQCGHRDKCGTITESCRP